MGIDGGNNFVEEIDVGSTHYKTVSVIAQQNFSLCGDIRMKRLTELGKVLTRLVSIELCVSVHVHVIELS